MYKLKKILLLILLFCSISLTFAQKKEVSKAITNGKNSNGYYVADLHKAKLSSNDVTTYCSNNNITIIECKTSTVVNFDRNINIVSELVFLPNNENPVVLERQENQKNINNERTIQINNNYSLYNAKDYCFQRNIDGFGYFFEYYHGIATQKFTLEFWLFLYEFSNNAQQAYYYNNMDVDKNGFLVVFTQTPVNNTEQIKSKFPLEKGKWYHIALSSQIGNDMYRIPRVTYLFIDGFPSDTARFEINPLFLNLKMHGEFDELKVYDFLKNDSQVRQNMFSKINSHVGSLPLIYYTFDDIDRKIQNQGTSGKNAEYIKKKDLAENKLVPSTYFLKRSEDYEKQFIIKSDLDIQKYLFLYPSKKHQDDVLTNSFSFKKMDFIPSIITNFPNSKKIIDYKNFYVQNQSSAAGIIAAYHKYSDCNISKDNIEKLCLQKLISFYDCINFLDEFPNSSHKTEIEPIMFSNIKDLYQVDTYIKYYPTSISQFATTQNYKYYKGGVLNGIPQGKGKAITGLGLYEGGFNNGLPNGNGVYLFYKENEIESYTGNFKEGKFDGSGYLVFREKKGEYNGSFKDGQFNGKGTFYYLAGFLGFPSSYDGIWENGTLVRNFTAEHNADYQNKQNQINEDAKTAYQKVKKEKVESDDNSQTQYLFTFTDGIYGYLVYKKETGKWCGSDDLLLVEWDICFDSKANALEWLYKYKHK